MKNIKLIFGTHNSQPVGVADAEIEEVYQQSYKPFLTNLYNHPEIQAVLHYSGLLLSWLEDKHPEFLMLLNDVVKRKQVELLGGGYYEPVLPLVPSSDRTGQIELLTTLLRRRFGRRPRGGWITERIWEPSLASTIKNSGMEYVFLDDQHFLTAGFEGSDMYRPCITEDQGKTLVVFPICTRLRHMVPGETPEATVDYILSQRDDENDARVIVLIDDGERYGLWNRASKNVVYKGGWFERFFELLAAQKGKIDTVAPGNYLSEHAPAKKGYFRCTSYEEMMSWTLDTATQRDFEKAKNKLSEKDKGPFLCGGYFRQFLSKYPESNMLYAKMMYTHLLVNQIRGDRARKKAAREELWRGEGHAPLWHGKHGGIYDNRLRKAAYRALIEAEKVTREKGIFKPSLAAVDFDMDGTSEYLYQGLEMNGYVHRVGGVLFELDHIKESWNYLDTLSRHREPYHDAASTPVDRYSRRAFVDHFFLPNENINSFDRMTCTELGNFIWKSYKVESYERDRNEVKLVANGRILYKTKQQPFEIKKYYNFKKTAISVSYTLHNTSSVPMSLNFGSEVNLSFQGNTAQELRLWNVEHDVKGKEGRNDIGLEKTIVEGVSELCAEDLANQVSVSVASTLPFKLWSLPVLTHSRSLNGEAETYQSTCLVPQWTLNFMPSEKWQVVLTIAFVK